MENGNSARDVSNQEYLHTTHAGVMVPIGQAVTTGFLLGLVILALSMRLGSYFLDALMNGSITWLLVTVIIWMALQGHWFWLTIADHLVAAPKKPTFAPTKHVIVDARGTGPGGGYQSTKTHFACTDEQLTRFCRGVCLGRPLSQRTWTTGKGAVFSQGEYLDVVEEMRKRKWIEYKNPQYPDRGYILTPDGTTQVQQLAAGGPPPSPTES